MSGDLYIMGVLANHEHKPGLFSALAPGIIVPKLKEWAGNNLNEISYVGSVAKGTAIAGTTDLDIFISLKPTTPHTLEEIYSKLYQKAVAENWMPRRQNVSIGISYLGARIDLVPGRLQEGFVYYHSLWKRKANTWTQSAPQIHITKVQQSGRLREIRAIKIWRKNHNLDFPSFYLELSVMAALSGCGSSLASNVQRALGYIADNLTTAEVEDPANTNNLISDDLTHREKLKIAIQAKLSHDETSWARTLW